MSARFSQQIEKKTQHRPIFSPAVFLKHANAITFIVVYIFNTGKFEIVSFNFESRFLNVSLSFSLMFFKRFLLDFFYVPTASAEF